MEDYPLKDEEAEYHLFYAISAGDYRAAQFVVNKASCHEYSRLQRYMDDQCLSALKKAYEKGFIQAARELGCFYYLKSDENEKLQNQAKKWFLKYLEKQDDLSVVRSFTYLFTKENVIAPEINFDLENLETDPNNLGPNPDEREQEKILGRQNAIKALEDHWKKFPSGSVACQIGSLYLELKPMDLYYDVARNWFEQAIAMKNGKAGRLLASMCTIARNKRQEIIEQAFCNGEISLAEDMANWPIVYDTDFSGEAISWLKRGFLAGETDCAKNLSRRILEEKTWEKNPNKVCWVHAAAQCDHEKSSKALLKKMEDNDYCNYAACAIAIMFELGFLKPKIAAKPNVIPEIIAKLNWNILEDYQNALKAEGLLEPYIADLFVKWKRSMVSSILNQQVSFGVKSLQPAR